MPRAFCTLRRTDVRTVKLLIRSGQVIQAAGGVSV